MSKFTENIEGISQATSETNEAVGLVVTAAQDVGREAEGLRTSVQAFFDRIKAA